MAANLRDLVKRNDVVRDTAHVALSQRNVRAGYTCVHSREGSMCADSTCREYQPDAFSGSLSLNCMHPEVVLAPGDDALLRQKHSSLQLAECGFDVPPVEADPVHLACIVRGAGARRW